MQAIILAGGYGTRLAPLTYTRAKPMLPLLNKPMIRYLIDALPPSTEIIVAANYKKEQLEDYFQENGINAIVNPEPKPLGTAGAVKNAARYINGTFLVLNGDIISSLNIRKFIQYHMEKKAKVTISLWPVKNVEQFGVVDIDRNGRIKKFIEKPRRQEAPSNLINAGAYCLDYSILDYIPDGKFTSMEAEIFPKVIEDGLPFYGYSFNGYWIDVGRMSSYIEANKLLLKKKGLKFVTGENCSIEGRIKESSIGNNCKIGENAEIKGSILYDNVEVGEEAIIENSIIGSNVVVKKGAMIKDTIVGDDEVVDGKIEGKKIWSKEMPKGYPKKQIGNVVKSN